jgi:hypothetical protein
MKKVLFFAVVLTGLTFAASAEGVFHLTRKGGCSSGFGRVVQNCDGNGNTVMMCMGAGQTNSDYVAPPNQPDLVDLNKVISFVNNEIQSGKLSGKAMVEGLPTEWEGSDVFNYTLTAGKSATETGKR